jgi:hypothetical protein
VFMAQGFRAGPNENFEAKLRQLEPVPVSVASPSFGQASSHRVGR